MIWKFGLRLFKNYTGLDIREKFVQLKRIGTKKNKKIDPKLIKKIVNFKLNNSFGRRP